MKIIKKPIAIIMLIAVTITGYSQSNTTVDYKKIALDLLTKSMEELELKVNSLTDEELKYVPKDGGWTVLNCLEHIAFTEPILGNKVKQMVVDSHIDLTKDLSANDWLVISKVTDRTNKVITPPPFRPKPENANKTREDFISEFKMARNETINFIKTTDADLRHLFAPYPYGEADAIQQCIVIGAHVYRHTMQIQEIIEELNPDKKITANLGQ